MCDCAYENTRRITYEGTGASFIPVCVQCHRFVRPDDRVAFTKDGLVPGPNATCSRCGRTEMHFEGFFF
jgi:hypothetical protein